MRYWIAAISFVGLSTGVVSLAADPPSDPLAAKKETLQWALDQSERAFRFPEAHEGVLYSLSQYSGDCEVHLITDRKKWPLLSFRFEREGKEVLTLNGHTGSVFRTANNVLYFAHFSANGCGCTVAAYDLTSGKKLWETKLNAVGTPSYSAYSNRVTMSLSSVDGFDKAGDGTVYITGKESFGDYIEILDRSSGTILAHKIYRQGFGSSK